MLLVMISSSFSDHIKTVLPFVRDISHLQSVENLLRWDQETYMPKGASESRALQLATIAKLVHERFQSPFLRDALSNVIDLETGAPRIPLNSQEESGFLKRLHRRYTQAVKLPAALVEAFALTQAKAHHAWEEARTKSDFSLFQSDLAELIRLSKEKAVCWNPGKPVYDVLLDEYEPDMAQAILDPLFAELKEKLVPLSLRLGTVSKTIVSPFKDPFVVSEQMNLSHELLNLIHFPMDRARLDQSTHPFTMNIHPNDVRITTRFNLNDIMEGISGTLHEAGHAFYELGLNATWFGTPLGEACSLGVHESQSRFWENHMGKSEAFWDYYFPRVAEKFPTQFKNVSQYDFFRWINKVTCSPIRVEADEVTYNLHIMVRYEIEKAMFTHGVPVSELPALWNSLYKDFLGIDIRDDKQGILQDVHWSCAAFGYFPTYTLGNLMAAQLNAALETQLPQIKAPHSPLLFKTILDWLNDSIFKYGQVLDLNELVTRATGHSLSSTPFIHYLESKYQSFK